MAKVYLPTEYLNKPCYQVYNDYIRVWNSTDYDSNTYYDVYFKNDYLVKQGKNSFSSHQACDSLNTYTDVIYYRYDFDKIIFLFLSLCIIFFYPGFKIFLRMFRRFR